MTMHRMPKMLCAVFCVLLLLPAAGIAQTATTGAIAGAVRDTTGAVLPGVTVEAASPALIEKIRAGVTDGEGQYNIVDLRPGVYTVTFSDVYNVFNTSAVMAFNANYGAEWRRPVADALSGGAIMNARLLQLGARLNF